MAYSRKRCVRKVVEGAAHRPQNRVKFVNYYLLVNKYSLLHRMDFFFKKPSIFSQLVTRDDGTTTIWNLRRVPTFHSIILEDYRFYPPVISYIIPSSISRRSVELLNFYFVNPFRQKPSAESYHGEARGKV
jgi:hypothetical protein